MSKKDNFSGEVAGDGREHFIKQFQAFLHDHKEHTICQAIFHICDTGYFSFDELGMLSIEDVVECHKIAESKRKLGEDFEAIMLTLNDMYDARSKFEEGIMSMPSFVARSKQWMSKVIGKGGEDGE